jgi:hypothetical protein
MFERIGLKLTASNLAYNSNPDFIRDRIIHEMRMQIADKIGRIGVIEKRHDYHTEFQCELFVCTYDEFYKAVQDEARKLAYGMAPAPTWVDTASPITKDQWDNACAGLGTKA